MNSLGYMYNNSCRRFEILHNDPIQDSHSYFIRNETRRMATANKTCVSGKNYLVL